MLKSLSLDEATSSDLILLLVFCLTITGLIVGWLLLTHNPTKKDRVQHYYDLFCAKLQAHGIQRKPGEGTVDFEKCINNEQTLAEIKQIEIRPLSSRPIAYFIMALSQTAA